MQQAREELLPRFLAQFHSAIRETFTTLHYPTRDRLTKADFLMEFKENHYDGEEQVQATLAEKQKYTDDISKRDIPQEGGGETAHTAIGCCGVKSVEGAATSTRDGNGIDRTHWTGLKTTCVHKDIWREEGSYINKGPFPRPATTVRIMELSRDDAHR